MASWELQLISRIVRTGDLDSVVEYGITLDDFLTSEGRGIFNVLLGYASTRETKGAVLGPNGLREIVPNFVLCDDEHANVQQLCFEVRKQRLASEYKEHLRRQLEIVERDPMSAINATQTYMGDLQNLGFERQTDVSFHTAFGEAIRKMELKEAGFDLSCGSWPWYPLQEATGGIQEDDYVVIYGRPKSMKSWVMAYLLAHMYNQQKRILIYTKEMSAENIFARAGACLAQIRYTEFRTGNLTFAEKESLYAVHEMLTLSQAQQQVVCLSGQDASEGGDTVPWLESKIKKYKPDIVFVDGMYLMSDAKKARKDNQRVANISRALRQIPLQYKCPVIATIQANRQAAGNKEANTDEVAFSDAISQDCTLLMRAINEKDQPTIALVMSGVSREFHMNGFRIYGIPALNFGYYGDLSDQDVEKAKSSDDGPAEKPVVKRKKNTTEAQALRNVKKVIDQGP